MKRFFSVVLFTLALCVISCGKQSTARTTTRSALNNVETTQDPAVAVSSQQQNDYSTKWKNFAGDTYRASELIHDIWQNYAFQFDSSGRGKYIMFGTLPNSNVVTDQMELEIYKVTSDAKNLYLYCFGSSSPIKITLKGYSLYTANGKLKYEKYR